MLPRNPQPKVQTTQTSFRLPADLHEKIKLACDEYQCSQADLIIDAIKFYFEVGTKMK
jgi:predicted DNA-binding protein